MEIKELLICGLPVPLFIQICVGLAKKLNFPSKYAPHLSAGIGMVCGVLLAVTGNFPIYYGIGAGVLLGAIACGTYDAAKSEVIV